MPIDLNTNGLDWRAHLRANEVFIALASPEWQRHAFHQRQLAYARLLGKPIYLLVPEWAEAPQVMDGEHLYYFTGVEDMGNLVREIMEGER